MVSLVPSSDAKSFVAVLKNSKVLPLALLAVSVSLFAPGLVSVLLPGASKRIVLWLLLLKSWTVSFVRAPTHGAPVGKR